MTLRHKVLRRMQISLYARNLSERISLIYLRNEFSVVGIRQKRIPFPLGRTPNLNQISVFSKPFRLDEQNTAIARVGQGGILPMGDHPAARSCNCAIRAERGLIGEMQGFCAACTRAGTGRIRSRSCLATKGTPKGAFCGSFPRFGRGGQRIRVGSRACRPRLS